MRFFLFLLFFILAFHAVPPISEVMEHNNERALDLENYYNSTFANNSTIVFSFDDYDQEQNISASIDIITLNLMLDNITHSMDDLALITARGHEQEHLTSLYAQGYPYFSCDADWFYGGAESAWRCDFDNDSCAEFENRTFVEYDIDVTFTFRNISEIVNYSSNVVPVPENIRDVMRNSSGDENLTVSFEGNVIFIYEINDREFLGDCNDNYTNVTASISFALNRSFVVGGEQKLFFLSSPILREQWFRNNQFNVVLLSQSPLYYVGISMDGAQSKNATLREFYNITDSYGLMYIISNKTNETWWSESRMNSTTPTPLQKDNNSFSYAYEFYHDYSALGKHNLSIVVNDSFLGFSSYKDTLLSRMLSYDGTTMENGSPVDEDISRKSTGFKRQEIGSFELSLGFVALVLFLAFLNFWIGRA